MEKTVDILIPTYKPGARFAALLQKLAVQTAGINRLILINTDEKLWTDEAEAALREVSENPESRLYGRTALYHIAKEAFDHAGTRRLAVSYSQADYFVCMTDDAVPADENLIAALLRGFEMKPQQYETQEQRVETRAQRIAMVYARQLPAPDCSEAECFTRQFNYPAESVLKTKRDLPRLGIKTYFASNVCCAYDRRLYDKLGGFVTEAVFNEDMLYAEKAIGHGYAILYAPDARVIHSHNYTGLQQLHRNFDLGMSQAMHPEVFSGLRAEGEGMRLVKQTALYLCKIKKPYLVPKLIWQSGCKYLGYRLGKSYKRLPVGAVHAFAMNRAFVARMNDNALCDSKTQSTECRAGRGAEDEKEYRAGKLGVGKQGIEADGAGGHGSEAPGAEESKKGGNQT